MKYSVTKPDSSAGKCSVFPPNGEFLLSIPLRPISAEATPQQDARRLMTYDDPDEIAEPAFDPRDEEEERRERA
ncbi:MAG: hypothetical protein WCA44_07405, partial [Acidobacteriaceae bacterium]